MGKKSRRHHRASKTGAVSSDDNEVQTTTKTTSGGGNGGGVFVGGMKIKQEPGTELVPSYEDDGFVWVRVTNNCREDLLMEDLLSGVIPMMWKCLGKREGKIHTIEARVQKGGTLRIRSMSALARYSKNRTCEVSDPDTGKDITFTPEKEGEVFEIPENVELSPLDPQFQPKYITDKKMRFVVSFKNTNINWVEFFVGTTVKQGDGTTKEILIPKCTLQPNDVQPDHPLCEGTTIFCKDGKTGNDLVVYLNGMPLGEDGLPPTVDHGGELVVRHTTPTETTTTTTKKKKSPTVASASNKASSSPSSGPPSTTGTTTTVKKKNMAAPVPSAANKASSFSYSSSSPPVTTENNTNKNMAAPGPSASSTESSSLVTTTESPPEKKAAPVASASSHALLPSSSSHPVTTDNTTTTEKKAAPGPSSSNKASSSPVTTESLAKKKSTPWIATFSPCIESETLSENSESEKHHFGYTDCGTQWANIKAKYEKTQRANIMAKVKNWKNLGPLYEHHNQIFCNSLTTPKIAPPTYYKGAEPDSPEVLLSIDPEDNIDFTASKLGLVTLSPRDNDFRQVILATPPGFLGFGPGGLHLLFQSFVWYTTLQDLTLRFDLSNSKVPPQVISQLGRWLIPVKALRKLELRVTGADAIGLDVCSLILPLVQYRNNILEELVVGEVAITDSSSRAAVFQACQFSSKLQSLKFLKPRPGTTESPTEKTVPPVASASNKASSSAVTTESVSKKKPTPWTHSVIPCATAVGLGRGEIAAPDSTAELLGVGIGGDLRHLVLFTPSGFLGFGPGGLRDLFRSVVQHGSNTLEDLTLVFDLSNSTVPLQEISQFGHWLIPLKRLQKLDLRITGADAIGMDVCSLVLPLVQYRNNVLEELVVGEVAITDSSRRAAVAQAWQLCTKLQLLKFLPPDTSEHGTTDAIDDGLDFTASNLGLVIHSEQGGRQEDLRHLLLVTPSGFSGFGPGGLRDLFHSIVQHRGNTLEDLTLVFDFSNSTVPLVEIISFGYWFIPLKRLKKLELRVTGADAIGMDVCSLILPLVQHPNNVLEELVVGEVAITDSSRRAAVAQAWQFCTKLQSLKFLPPR